MNKTQLIKTVATKTEFTQKDVTAVIDAFVQTVTEELVAGNDVAISGFGKFISAEVAERSGVIQMGERKGETYTTPAHKAPKFKASSQLKNALL